MKIIFVCHGNICRSPIAEILFKELDKENRFDVCSRAISNEESGNDIYPPMKRVLDQYGVKYIRHYATKINYEEFISVDYIFYMDKSNLWYLSRLFGESNKFHLISEYSDNLEVEDPWYTGRYNKVYLQIKGYIEDIYKKMTTER